jgi:P27 family predicted phage terminase small subunit
VKNAHDAPPKHLSPEAAAWWAEIVAEFSIDDAPGRLLLQSCCEALDQLRAAEREIESNGLCFTDRFGKPKTHPAATIVRDSRAQMLAALKQMNLDVIPPGPIGRPPGS